MTRFFSFFLFFAEIAGKRVFSPELEMESRIIGGQESWAHSWPWQVSLQFAAMPACGGAIISPLWVISAAHCFKRSEFSFRPGLAQMLVIQGSGLVKPGAGAAEAGSDGSPRLQVQKSFVLDSSGWKT